MGKVVDSDTGEVLSADKIDAWEYEITEIRVEQLSDNQEVDGKVQEVKKYRWHAKLDKVRVSHGDDWMPVSLHGQLRSRETYDKDARLYELGDRYRVFIRKIVK